MVHAQHMCYPVPPLSPDIVAYITSMIIITTLPYAVADPDLELRGGGGGGVLDLLALSAIFPSVISSFLPKIGGGGPRAPPPPLDPPLVCWCAV